MAATKSATGRADSSAAVSFLPMMFNSAAHARGVAGSPLVLVPPACLPSPNTSGERARMRRTHFATKLIHEHKRRDCRRGRADTHTRNIGGSYKPRKAWSKNVGPGLCPASPGFTRLHPASRHRASPARLVALWGLRGLPACPACGWVGACADTLRNGQAIITQKPRTPVNMRAAHILATALVVANARSKWRADRAMLPALATLPRYPTNHTQTHTPQQHAHALASQCRPDAAQRHTRAHTPMTTWLVCEKPESSISFVSLVLSPQCFPISFVSLPQCCPPPQKPDRHSTQHAHAHTVHQESTCVGRSVPGSSRAHDDTSTGPSPDQRKAAETQP